MLCAESVESENTVTDLECAVARSGRVGCGAESHARSIRSGVKGEGKGVSFAVVWDLVLMVSFGGLERASALSGDGVRAGGILCGIFDVVCEHVVMVLGVPHYPFRCRHPVPLGGVSGGQHDLELLPHQASTQAEDFFSCKKAGQKLDRPSELSGQQFIDRDGVTYLPTYPQGHGTIQVHVTYPRGHRRGGC